ncbi:MAG: MOSC domain-containing protein [Halobacteriales archaeon]
MANVSALFVAEAGSEPMEAIEEVEAVAGRGLRGDRYFDGTGYYAPFDTCQVTLIAGEAIAEIDAAFDLDLSAGEHRRNVVTEGVDVHDLLDHRFRVGDAVLEGTRPRPPCPHVEELAGEEGVASALAEGRGGICANVITTGEIRVGDPITDVEPLDRTDEIVDRLRASGETRE